MKSRRRKMWNPVEIAADLLKFYRVKLSDAGMLI